MLVDGVSTAQEITIDNFVRLWPVASVADVSLEIQRQANRHGTGQRQDESRAAIA
jgi:hypothetical protein